MPVHEANVGHRGGNVKRNCHGGVSGAAAIYSPQGYPKDEDFRRSGGGEKKISHVRDYAPRWRAPWFVPGI